MEELAVEVYSQPTWRGKGLSLRFTGEQVKELVGSFTLTNQIKRASVDWHALNSALNDWSYWKGPKFPTLVDDGRGFRGPCPYHHHAHMQVYLPGSTPMRCHEAMQLQVLEASQRR